MFIDTHCHLDQDAFDDDRQACIQRALAAGVSRLITIGTGGALEGARRAIALAEEYACIWASVGVHPHNTHEGFDTTELEALARHPRVVAVGETGLDFYRDWAPKDKQFEAFIAHIKVAKAVKKPLIIHSRNAGPEALDVLQAEGTQEVGGVFHCFSEDAAFAARLHEINFKVSFPGQLTFKKADSIREVCAAIPIEQIMIETDSPYLAPEPHRGKRCEPAFVVETAKRLAQVKGLSLEQVAAITTANALKLFSSLR
jgi:TatD DNase family protein